MTATDAEVKAAGFTLPRDTDMINEGDDAISDNARAAYELISATAYRRGKIPDGTDIDTMRGKAWTGAWDTPSAGPSLDSLKGTWPTINGTAEPRLGIFTVQGTLSNLSNMGYQTLSLLASGAMQETSTWIRYNKGYNASGPAAWTDWVRMDTGDLEQRVTALEDAPSGTAPEFSTNALATGNRDMRLQLFRDAYPLVSTGGKGAVVFRYDHGLTNFKNVLKPLHDQYGLKAYIAMNSRNWSLPENAGATVEEAKTWTGVEWGNHTTDHNDQDGIEAIYDSIVNGRVELEDQLGRTIHGFTVPGLIANGDATDKFEGWGSGGASGYSNTYAGGLIVSHHAIVSGTVGAVQRPLDGQIRLGTRHWTWESAAWEDIKAQIDAAVTGKTALTLMCHPRTMGATSGGATYWDAALAEQVLAYVRSLIDAGDLADISYYQSHRAQLAPLPPAEVDTGWVEQTADGPSTAPGSTYKLRRIGRSVLMNVTGLVAGDTSNGVWLSIPSGYRPIGDAARLLDTNTSGVTNPPVTTTIVASTGSMYVRDRAGSSLASGITLDGVIEWTTLDSPPAPGTNQETLP